MDTMQSLQRDGLFWLPDNPTKKVGGRLTFDSQDGLQLQLIGSLQSIKDIESGGTQIRIHGATREGQLTLDRCFLAKAEIIGSEVPSETYRPELVLDGEHISNVESLSVDRAYIGLFNLSQWVWRDGVTIDHTETNNNGVSRGIKINYTPPEDQYIDTEFGQLRLVSQSEFIQGVTRTYTLKVSRLLELVLTHPMSINSITKFAAHLQDLLTICTCKASAVESLAVATLGSQQRIGVLTNMIGPDPRDLQVEHPASMYLTFDDIGGMKCIRAWLKLRAKYGIVPRLLVDHTYNKNTYVDIRFLNTVIAAETLLRVRTNTKEVMLREGLQQLAEESGTVASDLVGDISSWAENIRTTRNALVHRDVVMGKRPDYFALAESVYWMVVMSMLRECGVPEYALAKIAKNRWFEYVASSLRWPNSRV